MRMPTFSADRSLSRSPVHYRTGNHYGATTLSSVQPSWRSPHDPPRPGCWCSEPDTRTVCDWRGNCYEKSVCLQWFCPRDGGDIDPSDL